MGATGRDKTESPQKEGEEKWAQLRAQHWRRAPALPPSAVTSPRLSLSVTGPQRVLRASQERLGGALQSWSFWREESL